MPFPPIPDLQHSTDRCICCEHPIAAATIHAREQAVQDHVDYVNRYADRSKDPHFEDGRLTHLVAQ